MPTEKIKFETGDLICIKPSERRRFCTEVTYAVMEVIDKERGRVKVIFYRSDDPHTSSHSEYQKGSFGIGREFTHDITDFSNFLFDMKESFDITKHIKGD